MAATRGDEDGLVALRGSLQELTSLLVAEEPLETVLQRVVELARASIGACDLASITYVNDDMPWTIVYTDEVARQIDEVQYAHDSGPCLDAYRLRQLVSVPSMPDGEAWREFRSAAINCGVQASFSLPLTTGDVRVGALNLYARRDRAFTGVPEDPALLFAAQATAAVWNARLHDQARMVVQHLEAALETRDVIGMAKGIIMANDKATSDEAFAVLRNVSQRLNVKVRDLAVEVVATGETPPLAPLTPDE